MFPWGHSLRTGKVSGAGSAVLGVGRVSGMGTVGRVVSGPVPRPRLLSVRGSVGTTKSGGWFLVGSGPPPESEPRTELFVL